MLLNVAVCTCLRPRLLTEALDSLMGMTSPEEVEVVVTVVDNDPDLSAKATVDQYTDAEFELYYVSEPRRGIPFARNTAVKTAISLDADYLIFIDDDERVKLDWMILLFNFCQQWRSVQASSTILFLVLFASIPNCVHCFQRRPGGDRY